MLRVLAVVQKGCGLSPGQRFRLEQWAPHLRERHGICLDFCAFESKELTHVLYTPGQIARKGALMVRDFARRANILRLAREYDAVAVYREFASIGPALYERVLARLRTPFLLDFDDAIWMPNPAAPTAVNGVFSRLRFPGKTKTIARLASAVTVGNAFLARWARQHNSNVHVVPTSIDLSTYSLQPPLMNEVPFSIGWMGSFSTLVHLEQVRSAVERFGTTRRTRFVVVCDRPLEKPFANVETVFVKWQGHREAEDIGSMHIGIMPLIDFAFSEGKCGCKALQYMAAGRPAVIAPVGVNVDIVEHGKNGMLARTEGEWLAAFEALACSSDLRSRLTVEGRKTVEERFSSQASAAAFAAALESMVNESARTGLRAEC